MKQFAIIVIIISFQVQLPGSTIYLPTILYIMGTQMVINFIKFFLLTFKETINVPWGIFEFSQISWWKSSWEFHIFDNEFESTNKYTSVIEGANCYL